MQVKPGNPAGCMVSNAMADASDSVDSGHSARLEHEDQEGSVKVYT